MTDTPPRRLVLWGVGTSRTLRAHWALHELGLDYECRPILPRTGETQTQEYTELNPRQKIPLLQDGDFKIAESPAIAAYLSNTHGHPRKRTGPDRAVGAGDVANHKPAPDGLLHIGKLAAGAELWYVGDTVDDARSARAAGVPFIGIAAPSNPLYLDLVFLFQREGPYAIVDDINYLGEVFAS